ncbi:RsiV family protein [Kaistella sp. DKR-2]|uniref:RsiV family protein n=1 Tax=Kaistella soli TaxID=2849654 RepID=UPI001C251477|nr:RsiV family protein [Kaistella soli]MBU8881902.1 RsiV family protein [Kaistella soli]
MKNITALSSLFILLFLSCTKPEKSTSVQAEKTETNKAVTNVFDTDSVKIHDSLKIDRNLTAAFQSTVLFFPNLKNKTLLDSIYSTANIKLKAYSKASLLAELNLQKQTFYEGTKESLQDWKPDFKQTWNQTSDMKLFSTLNDYMTLQYTSSGYTGGAHGYYNELYKVFDVKNNRTIQLTDVLKVRDAKIWGRILMDHFLKNDLEKGQAKMLLVKEIPLNNNFYFDKEHLFFLYNQYEIAAYAAGPVLIKIPFSEIKPFLNADFRNKMNL